MGAASIIAIVELTFGEIIASVAIKDDRFGSKFDIGAA